MSILPEHPNPHHICTWDDASRCSDCGLRATLGCRLDPREFRFFILNQIPSLVIATFGLALVGLVTGVWWPLVVFGAACIALWGLGIETRVLCSHCPYWAEGGKTLHCWALTGSPKIWRYRPGPMKGWEKAAIIAFFSFLMAFPVLAQACGIAYLAANYLSFGLYALLGMSGVTIATVLAGLQFFLILKHCFCSRCVNFSCPLNDVPKKLVDEYLRKNPVMKEAWEKNGYRLGH